MTTPPQEISTTPLEPSHDLLANPTTNLLTPSGPPESPPMGPPSAPPAGPPSPNVVPMDALMALAPAVSEEPEAIEAAPQPEIEPDEVSQPSLSTLENESNLQPMFDPDSPKVSPGEFFGADEEETAVYGTITEKERITHQQVAETRSTFVVGSTMPKSEEPEDSEPEIVEEQMDVVAEPEPEPVKHQPKADYDAWDDAWKEPDPEPKPDRVVKSTDSLNVELEW